MNTIKKILRPLCFFLIFCIITVALTDILYPHNMYHSGIKGFYKEDRDSLDMIFLSSSGSCMSWIPYEAYNKFGFTSYAFGNSLAPSFSYCALLKEALKRQSPGLVLIDARAYLYTYSFIEEGEAYAPYHTIKLTSSMPLLSPNRLSIVLDNYRVFKNSLSREDRIKKQECLSSFLFDIIRYHSNIFFLTPQSFQDNVFDLPANYAKGFCYSDLYTDVITEIPHEDCSSVTDEAPVDENALRDLDELLNMLDSKGLEALFVISPCAETPEQKAVFNSLSHRVKERGYDFLDINDHFDEIGIDENRDFSDDRHMNYSGASKSTAFLGKYLTDNYSFIAQHSTETASKWDTGYEMWRELSKPWEQSLAEKSNDIL